MDEVRKIKLGLALGSGAARGWAHIGALHALAELGIRPDVICGTSIGSLVGGFLLTGRLDELENWARGLSKLKMLRYLDIRVNGNGMIAGNRLFAEMERGLGETRIESLPVPFASVATDLHTGHEVWMTKGLLAPAIRASFSLPGLFEPVLLDERWVIDGALVNPVPVSVCHALGAQVVIAVNLNTPPARSSRPYFREFDKVRIDPSSGWSGGLFRARGKKSDSGKKPPPAKAPEAPGLIGVLSSTLNLVQDRVTRSRLAADPPDVNIVPRVGHVGLLDFHAAIECIEAGAVAVYQAEADIRDAMCLFDEAVA